MASNGLKRHLQTMARYNRWANNACIKSARALSPRAYAADHGLPFLSVGATFNHIIFADALWYMRITGAESLPHVLPVTIPDATALAGFWRDGTRFGQAIPDIEEASERMTAMSDTWVDFVDGLDADKLEDEFSYADTKGQSHTQQLSRILGHVVNHATHHRGQISAVVNKLTGQYHVSDMPPFFESPEAELP